MNTRSRSSLSLGKERTQIRGKFAIIERTRQSRESRDESDSAEQTEDMDEQTDKVTEIVEEQKDSNDVYRDGSGAEFDVSHQAKPHIVARCLLPVRPQGQWRVLLKDNDIAVESSGAGVKSTHTPLSDRRKEVLTIAAHWQLEYLKTGNIDALVVLDTSELLARIIATGNNPEVVTGYKQRQFDIASDIKGQFFYAPWGALHAFRFLLQDDICGIAMARVWHAMHAIVADERKDLRFLTDSEVAEKLNEHFKVSEFNAPRVARWREIDDESSTKRFYFPNRDNREAACKPKRPKS